MRFEQNGMSLWYGTPDAPAPDDAVQSGAGITITIGVQPVDASNKVEVHYRINQGPVCTLSAEFLRTDVLARAQYFKARFPKFQPSDTVEYLVGCRCAGRQVPRADEQNQFASSFRITGPSLPPATNLTPEIAFAAVSPGDTPLPAPPQMDRSQDSVVAPGSAESTAPIPDAPPLSAAAVSNATSEQPLVDANILESTLETNPIGDRGVVSPSNLGLLRSKGEDQSRATQVILRREVNTLPDSVINNQPVGRDARLPNSMSDPRTKFL